MFLTTNIVGHFDTAIKSRIHFPIKYPNLSYSSRCELWRAFLTRTSNHGELVWLSDAAIKTLAKEDFNGRQIKNIVRTAYAMAGGKGRPIILSDVMVCVHAMNKFEEDFEIDRQERAEPQDEDFDISGPKQKRRRITEPEN